MNRARTRGRQAFRGGGGRIEHSAGRGLAILALFLLAAVAPLPASAHDRLGANLNFIADFFRNHEFNDLVKQSRAFLKAGGCCFDDGNAAHRATVGADGWPTEDFKLFPMTAQAGVSGLGGTYRLVFTGPPGTTVAATGAALQNRTFDAATATHRADIVFAAGGDGFFLDFTGTGGNVKNVRLLRPGVPEAGTPMFTPAWLAHTRRFNVLRFLDWTRTNGNRHVNWADRTTPEKLRTETLIAQWETVIAAANALGRDAWINIPVQASDEYVTSLAALFRDTLDPGLNLYLEYGNELWNFSLTDQGMDAFNGGAPFNGAAVNRSLAAASPANSPLRYDGNTNETTLAQRRVALRLKQISDIFRTVWGPAAINTRVRPVLAGQMANSSIVAEGLAMVEHPRGLNTAPNAVFYAISGAPYIFASADNDGNADEAPGMTVQQILDGMAAGVANAPSESSYQYLSHAGMGAWYGLKVLAYEAGFDNFGANNIANKRLANLDPRIRTICKDYIDQWHAFGFEQLLWFNAGAGTYDTQFGMWPLLEDMGNPAVPKNQCMDEILAGALPAITAGRSIASAVPGGAFRGSAGPDGALTGLAGPFGFPGYVEYLLRADTAGTYSLVFNGSAPAGETFRVELNNALVNADVVLPASTGDSAAVSVTLRQGLNAMRIRRSAGASWTVNRFTFTLTSAAPALSRSATSIDFGGQSMGTTAPPQTLTLTNSGTAGITISAIAIGGTQFAHSHNCTNLDAGASCTVTITFMPAAAAGAVNAAVPVGATLTIASNASGSPHTVSLSGTAEKSLITHYYRSILRRAPDAGGKAFWQGEAARVAMLGANVNEVWYALAMAFFTSAEYLGQNRGDSGFVSDLYNTFFNRAPDSGGLAFWLSNLGQGMPREVALAEFMFSAEFRDFARAIFGNTAVRAEIDMLGDFYRGLLARPPDDSGFGFWRGRFRTAQCQGSAAVTGEVEAISSAFALSGEYAGRGRSPAQYVGDLYNAFLRRGGDLAGVRFWIGQITGGARSREQVRVEFRNSPEFVARVNAVIAQGCLQ